MEKSSSSRPRPPPRENVNPLDSILELELPPKPDDNKLEEKVDKDVDEEEEEKKEEEVTEPVKEKKRRKKKKNKTTEAPTTTTTTERTTTKVRFYHLCHMKPLKTNFFSLGQ